MSTTETMIVDVKTTGELPRQYIPLPVDGPLPVGVVVYRYIGTIFKATGKHWVILALERTS